MRIVYVLTSLGMGGAEKQVLSLAARMAQHGHTVSLLVLRPRLAQEWPTPFEVVHLDMRRTPASVFAGILKARRFLRAFRPELLHGHCFHANLVARLLHGLAPMRVVCTVHNIDEGGWPRMLAYRLTDPLCRLTTAVCDAAAVRFIRLKAIPQDKCMVIANGIDTGEFSPRAEEQRARIRADLGATGEFIWLAAGRIVPAKDYPNLLRAFALVHTTSPNARLWIAAEATGPEFARLNELSAELGLNGCMKCLGLCRDMPALLDAADGFVLSSAWEGMPLVVGEAMAMEKSVVATDVGGVRQMVGDAGVLVPSDDASALAQAMLAVMQMPMEDRQTQGRAARTRIQAEFDLDGKLVEWESLYRSLDHRAPATDN